MTDTQNEAVAPPKVHNGTYTVNHPEHGHFTLKLYTVMKGNLAGKRLLALMTGPDNESDFSGVAFWDDDRLRANVWKKYKSVGREVPIDGSNWSDRWLAADKKLSIWLNIATKGPDGFWAQEGYTMMLEARCVRCNKKLTTPESIVAGIGPTCRGER